MQFDLNSDTSFPTHNSRYANSHLEWKYPGYINLCKCLNHRIGLFQIHAGLKKYGSKTLAKQFGLK